MKHILLVVVAVMTIGLGAGCGIHSQEEIAQANEVRVDMMPDLMNYSQTDQEILNMVTRNMILDGRGFVQDNIQFWLMDQPSALSMYPVH